MESMTFDELDHLLESVRDAADDYWQFWVQNAIYELAATGEPFTSDDVHAYLEGRGAVTGSPNAMGAMFNKARHDGLIVSEGMYRPSTRRTAHRRMVRIWKGAA